MLRHREETVIYEPENRPSPDTISANTFIMDFPALLWRREPFLKKNHEEQGTRPIMQQRYGTFLFSHFFFFGITPAFLKP
jgi:hypothetical protein